MKQHGLTFEEHTIGAKYETLGRTVSETDIVSFVNLCGFNEPLFMDMEYVARESVFKGRAATSEPFVATRTGARRGSSPGCPVEVSGRVRAPGPSRQACAR